MNPTPQRFVRTPESIAAALGIPCSKQFRRELAEFRTWEDWPRKNRHGFNKDEVIAFWDRNASRIAANRHRAKLADPNNFGKITAADLKVLHAGAHKPEPEFPDADEPLKNYNTQSAMAAAIQAKYGDRLKYVVTQQIFSQWCKGENLPKGVSPAVPPPPARKGNYYNGAAMETWVESHLLRAWPKTVDAQGVLVPDLAAQAQESEHRTKILNQQIAELEFKAATGKYIEADRARLVRRAALRAQHQLFRRLLENEDHQAALNDLTELGLAPEKLQVFRERDLARRRAVVDRIETEYEKQAGDLTTDEHG